MNGLVNHGGRAIAAALAMALVAGVAGCRRGPVSGGRCKTDVDCVADERCDSGTCRKRLVGMPSPARRPAPAPLPNTPPREPLRRAMDPRYQQSGSRGADDKKLMPAVPQPQRRLAPEHQRVFLPDA